MPSLTGCKRSKKSAKSGSPARSAGGKNIKEIKKKQKSQRSKSKSTSGDSKPETKKGKNQSKTGSRTQSGSRSITPSKSKKSSKTGTLSRSSEKSKKKGVKAEKKSKGGSGPYMAKAKTPVGIRKTRSKPSGPKPRASAGRKSARASLASDSKTQEKSTGSTKSGKNVSKRGKKSKKESTISRSEKSEKKVKTAKSSKSGKKLKKEKSEKSAKGGKSDKSLKSAKGGKSDKSGKSAKGGKSDKSGKSAKSGKSDKSAKSASIKGKKKNARPLGSCAVKKRSKKSASIKKSKKEAKTKSKKSLRAKSSKVDKKRGKPGTSTSSASSTLTGDTEYEAGVMTSSYWPKATTKKQAGRMVVVMRSAERVDRIFGKDWKTTEAPHGYLTPTDLNIPHNATSKKLLYSNAFDDNPPITAFGKYCTQLSARAMCNRGITCQLIVCSPTLRSIQTGDALARFLKAKIAVEPGLLEPLSWYRTTDAPLPDFHLDVLSKFYPIDSSYSPVMSMDTVEKLFEKETEVQGVSRVDFVLRNLCAEQRKTTLVVVAHAITLATAVAMASPQGENKGSKASSGAGTAVGSNEYRMDVLENEIVDQVNLGIRFPPGSVVALSQVNKGPPFFYELCPSIVPPLSYGDYFCNKPVLEVSAL